MLIICKHIVINIVFTHFGKNMDVYNKKENSLVAE